MSEIDAKIRKLMAEMPNAFNPDKAAGVDATIVYNLTGEGGSVWTSRIADGKCTVEEGEVENPTLKITMDAQDYIDMMAGRLDGMQAFMMGKIKVQGDIMLASRLMTFFS
ncbi:MAG: SCP2 sterol-binding domain-containing protein [Chloroflexi bacterium]|nr:SCP2 sterol-binding domain-containing protein [Chloroflexota bacterium]